MSNFASNIILSIVKCKTAFAENLASLKAITVDKETYQELLNHYIVKYDVKIKPINEKDMWLGLMVFGIRIEWEE